ncbi:MAG: putative bifunctional diguanylate cyclase/phosphodiesterase [Actinomycetes bacterium]
MAFLDNGACDACRLARVAEGGGALTYSDVVDDPAQTAAVVRSLALEIHQLRAIFERSPIATAVLDAEGRILRTNPALCRFLGRSDTELLATSLLSLTLDDDPTVYADGVTEQRLQHAAGHEVWAIASAVDLPEAGEGALLVCFDDATTRRNTEKMLLHAALHDSLTNLPNRRLLRDRLETALTRAERSHKTVAVLFIDLDDFKKINDNLGHEAGDTVLVAIARNIISALRTCDTVARIGGDEFVVLCEDVSGEGDISALVSRLLEAIRRPVVVGGRSAAVSASIGVAVPGPRHESSDQLVRMADLAMYRAKSRPEVDYVLADDTLATLGTPGGGILAELRHAIQADQLQLHYQPIVQLDGRVIGLEALLRWQHPRLGMLLPRDFLHVAEGGELAGPLSDWVLRTAIVQAAGWHDATLRVSVNVWAYEVARPGFADTVAALLTWAGLQARSLYLEMHEGDLPLAGPGLATELDQLREMGVGLAIDDYGTGGSSLASLRRLPVDTLKIDRTFIAGVVEDATDAAIVEAVATAARATGRHLVAAGVENVAQLCRLRDLGYTSVQGYLTGAPRPLHELGDVIHHRHVDIDLP